MLFVISYLLTLFKLKIYYEKYYFIYFNIPVWTIIYWLFNLSLLMNSLIYVILILNCIIYVNSQLYISPSNLLDHLKKFSRAHFSHKIFSRLITCNNSFSLTCFPINVFSNIYFSNQVLYILNLCIFTFMIY